jgi:hypothetical protein
MEKKPVNHSNIWISPVLKKLSKAKFKEKMVKSYPNDKVDWDKRYEKLHAPAKEENK